MIATSLFREKTGGKRFPPAMIQCSPSRLALRYGMTRRKNFWFCPGTIVNLQGGAGAGIMLV